MKGGSFLFVFGARRTIHRVINAFEDSGFLLKDTLAWKKPSAHHRAQRINIVLERRGLVEETKKWDGWRLGNLAPIWEPIAWFMKPYKIGGTITDNICNYSGSHDKRLTGKSSFKRFHCAYHFYGPWKYSCEYGRISLHRKSL